MERSWQTGRSPKLLVTDLILFPGERFPHSPSVTSHWLCCPGYSSPIGGVFTRSTWSYITRDLVTDYFLKPLHFKGFGEEIESKLMGLPCHLSFVPQALYLETKQKGSQKTKDWESPYGGERSSHNGSWWLKQIKVTSACFPYVLPLGKHPLPS